MHTYQCNVPILGTDSLPLRIETGKSIIIIGANGSGKTRLGIHLENHTTGHVTHRIGAHKKLKIEDDLGGTSEERARNSLRFGYANGDEANRVGNRWQHQQATHLLDDFAPLLQALFAENNRTAIKYLEQKAKNKDVPIPDSNLRKLKAIWQDLLPHRDLELLEASVQVTPSKQTNTTSYPASQLSDGERAIIYFLGQALCAPENGVLIVDEPEGHVHKAILGPLWGAAEKARPDCAFIYITHDLDFCAARPASSKYFLRSYSHDPMAFEIEALPTNTGLPEALVAELVGSRKPILFVEGERGSLDLTIYRALYGNFTIVPVGSCEKVIHSVSSFQGSSSLHRLEVRGLVDGDERDEGDEKFLNDRGIFILPVSEIENLLLLPDVFKEVANVLLCKDADARTEELKKKIFLQASANAQEAAVTFTLRQLDRKFKQEVASCRDIESLNTNFSSQIANLRPATFFDAYGKKLQKAFDGGDVGTVLKLYSNKGLLAIAASLVGLKHRDELLEKLERALGSKEGKSLLDALKKVMPVISLPVKEETKS